MTNSTNNNNNFDIQQLIDKAKAMVTPEKRAEMMAKAKAIWAILNEKPANSKPDLKAEPAIQEKIAEKKLVDSNINAEIKPATQEKTAEEKPKESE